MQQLTKDFKVQSQCQQSLKRKVWSFQPGCAITDQLDLQEVDSPYVTKYQSGEKSGVFYSVDNTTELHYDIINVFDIPQQSANNKECVYYLADIPSIVQVGSQEQPIIKNGVIVFDAVIDLSEQNCQKATIAPFGTIYSDNVFQNVTITGTIYVILAEESTMTLNLLSRAIGQISSNEDEQRYKTGIQYKQSTLSLNTQLNQWILGSQNDLNEGQTKKYNVSSSSESTSSTYRLSNLLSTYQMGTTGNATVLLTIKDETFSLPLYKSTNAAQVALIASSSTFARLNDKIYNYAQITEKLQYIHQNSGMKRIFFSSTEMIEQKQEIVIRETKDENTENWYATVFMTYNATIVIMNYDNTNGKEQEDTYDGLELFCLGQTENKFFDVAAGTCINNCGTGYFLEKQVCYSAAMYDNGCPDSMVAYKQYTTSTYYTCSTECPIHIGVMVDQTNERFCAQISASANYTDGTSELTECDENHFKYNKGCYEVCPMETITDVTLMQCQEANLASCVAASQKFSHDGYYPLCVDKCQYYTILGSAQAQCNPVCVGSNCEGRPSQCTNNQVLISMPETLNGGSSYSYCAQQCNNMTVLTSKTATGSARTCVERCNDLQLAQKLEGQCYTESCPDGYFYNNGTQTCSQYCVYSRTVRINGVTTQMCETFDPININPNCQYALYTSDYTTTSGDVVSLYSCTSSCPTGTYESNRKCESKCYSAATIQFKNEQATACTETCASETVYYNTISNDYQCLIANNQTEKDSHCGPAYTYFLTTDGLFNNYYLCEFCKSGQTLQYSAGATEALWSCSSDACTSSYTRLYSVTQSGSTYSINVCYPNNQQAIGLKGCYVVQQSGSAYTCKDSCNAGEYSHNNVCSTTPCDENQFVYSTVCKDNCYSVYNVQVTGQSISQYYKIISNEKECQAGCESDDFRKTISSGAPISGSSTTLNTYQCLDQCDELNEATTQIKAVLRGSYTCVDQKDCTYYNSTANICEGTTSDPNSLYCPYTNSIDSTRFSCDTSCKSGTYGMLIADIYSCESDCSSSQFYKYIDEAGAICVSRCAYNYYQVTSNNLVQCLSSCANNMFRGLDSGHDATYNRCDTNCYDFVPNKAGVMVNNIGQCQASCAQTSEISINGICSTGVCPIQQSVQNVYLTGYVENKICAKECIGNYQQSGSSFYCLDCQQGTAVLIPSGQTSGTTCSTQQECINQNFYITLDSSDAYKNCNANGCETGQIAYTTTSNTKYCLEGSCNSIGYVDPSSSGVSCSTTCKYTYTGGKYVCTEDGTCPSEQQYSISTIRYNPVQGLQCTDCLVTGYVIEDNNCFLGSCSSTKKLNTLTHQCIDASEDCPSGLITTSTACVSACTGVSEALQTVVQGSQTTYYCTSQCSSDVQFQSLETVTITVGGSAQQISRYVCAASCAASETYYSIVYQSSSKNYYRCQSKDTCFSNNLIYESVVSETMQLQVCTSSCTSISSSYAYYYSATGSETDFKMCSTACSSFYPYLEGSECKSSCSYYKVYSSSQASQALYYCVSACSSNEYIEVIDASESRCVSSCVASNLYNQYATISFNGHCYSQCPKIGTVQYYMENNTCVTSCTLGSYDETTFECIDACNVYYMVSGQKSCVSSCPTTASLSLPYQLYNQAQQGYECVAQCSMTQAFKYTYNENTQAKVCTDNCPQYTLYENSGSNTLQCSSQCTGFSYENGNCLLSGACGTLSDSDNTVYYNNNNTNQCLAVCANFVASIENSPYLQCYDSCTVSQSQQQTMFRFYAKGENRMCTIDCPQHDPAYYISGSSVHTYRNIQQCVTACPSRLEDKTLKFLYYDNVSSVLTCNSQCTYDQTYYISANFEYMCVSKSYCNYYIIGNNNNRQCLVGATSCQDSGYAYYNQVGSQYECRYSCEAKYNGSQCVDSCSTNKYIVDGTRQICQQVCAPYVNFPVDIKVLNTQTNEWVYDHTEYQCLDGCDVSGRFLIPAETEGGEAWCNASCPQTFTYISSDLTSCLNSCSTDISYFKTVNVSSDGTNKQLKFCLDDGCDDLMEITSLYTELEEVETGLYECVSYCVAYGEGLLYMTTSGECADKCESGTFAVENVCKESCSDLYKYAYKQTDEQSQISSTICVTSCRDQELFVQYTESSVQKYTCVSCDSQLYTIAEQEYYCQSSCDELIEYQTEIFPEVQAKQCTANCIQLQRVDQQCLAQDETCSSLNYNYYETITLTGEGKQAHKVCISSCAEASTTKPVVASQIDNQCIATCTGTSLQYEKYQAGVKMCVSDCQEDGFMYQDNTCISDCHYYIQTVGEQQQRICTSSVTTCDNTHRYQVYHAGNLTYECKSTCDNYVTQLSVQSVNVYYCQTFCSTMVFQRENSINTCIESCSYYWAYANTNNVLKQCAQSCSSINNNYVILSSTTKQCSTACTSNIVVMQSNEKQCLDSYSSCTFYVVKDSMSVCVTSCSNNNVANYTMSVGKKCVAQCPENNDFSSSYKYISGQTCVSQCPQNLYVVGLSTQGQTQYTCASTCSGSTNIQVYEQAGYPLRCASAGDCSNGYYSVSQNNQYAAYCVATCPGSLVGDICTIKSCTGSTTYIQQIGSTNSYQCVASCTTYVIQSTNECVSDVSKCQSKGFAFYATNKRCYQSCKTFDASYVTFTETNGAYLCSAQCDQAASSTKKFQEISGLCSTSCSTKIVIDSTNVCQTTMEQCQFYYTASGVTHCITQCSSSSLYIYVQGSQCLTACSNGYLSAASSLQGLYNCMNSCPIYYNSDNQCVTYCPSNAIYLQTTQMGTYCAIQCTMKILVQNNQNICQSECSQQAVIQGQYCQVNCNESYVISDSDMATCVTQCSSTQIYQVINEKKYCTQARNCVYYYQVDSVWQQCVDSCTDISSVITYYIKDNQYCVQSCDYTNPKYYIATDTVKQCTTSCRNNEFISYDQTICLKSCPTEYPFKNTISAGTQCVATCPQFVDNDLQKCIADASSCSFIIQSTVVGQPTQCVSSCPSNIYLYNTDSASVCKDSCSSDGSLYYFTVYTLSNGTEQTRCLSTQSCSTNWKYQSHITNGRITSVECFSSACPSDLVESSLECLESCPEGLENFNGQCATPVQQSNTWINAVIIIVVVFVIILVAVMTLVCIRRKKRLAKAKQVRGSSADVDNDYADDDTVGGRGRGRGRNAEHKKAEKKSEEEKPKEAQHKKKVQKKVVKKVVKKTKAL